MTTTCFLWAYASAPNLTTSTGQGDIPISSTGCTCFAFFRLFTQVHLLIDGSVEDQYATIFLSCAKLSQRLNKWQHSNWGDERRVNRIIFIYLFLLQISLKFSLYSWILISAPTDMSLLQWLDFIVVHEANPA